MLVSRTMYVRAKTAIAKSCSRVRAAECFMTNRAIMDTRGRTVNAITIALPHMLIKHNGDRVV